jgi:hypothetical protein
MPPRRPAGSTTSGRFILVNRLRFGAAGSKNNLDQLKRVPGSPFEVVRLGSIQTR